MLPGSFDRSGVLSLVAERLFQSRIDHIHHHHAMHMMAKAACHTAAAPKNHNGSLVGSSKGTGHQEQKGLVRSKDASS